MSPPSDDDSNSPDDARRTGVERDEIDPPNRDERGSNGVNDEAAASRETRTAESTAATRTAESTTPQPAESIPTATAEPTTESAPLVDSNWWYAVAAVPLYFVLAIVGGTAAVVLFFGAVAVDIGGGMGVASGLFFLIAVLAGILFAGVGTLLLVLFPVGIYLDAKAVAAAPVDWEPDPVFYGLMAAATALFSALTISLVVAIYYLYRRNQAVGIP